jgi:hypothetical protein
LGESRRGLLVAAILLASVVLPDVSDMPVVAAAEFVELAETAF